jgi:hypothetical protein
MEVGAVTGAVVGEDPLDRDPHPLEPRDRPPQEGGRGGALLVGQHLDVGEAGGVVDADVEELSEDASATRVERRRRTGAKWRLT